MHRRYAEVTADQKSDALRAVLESHGFQRSEGLRKLLEYLHRQEELGRAESVTEHEIAVEALGRPADFSPETDSSVRTRIMTLRRKLEEYYGAEGHGEQLRIEIPRGTYALHFVSAPAAVPAPATPETDVPAPPAASRQRPGWISFAAGLLAGAVLLASAFGLWQWFQARSTATESRLLRAAWGPMLDRGASVILAIGAPTSFYIRDFGEVDQPLGPVPPLPLVPQDPSVQEWFLLQRKKPLSRKAVLQGSAHAPLWGDAAAAFAILQMLGAHGVAPDVVPALRVHPLVFREKHSIILGRPEYNEQAAAFHPADGLSVEYSSKHRAVGVHNRAPKPGEPEWWFAEDPLRHSHGLITVVTGAAQHRTVLFAGINSDGTEAGARFFTSPEKLAVLDSKFLEAGLKQWPERFQVVIRTESEDAIMIGAQFEFLRILK